VHPLVFSYLFSNIKPLPLIAVEPEKMAPFLAWEGSPFQTESHDPPDLREELEIPGPVVHIECH